MPVSWRASASLITLGKQGHLDERGARAGDSLFRAVAFHGLEENPGRESASTKGEAEQGAGSIGRKFFGGISHGGCGKGITPGGVYPTQNRSNY